MKVINQMRLIKLLTLNSDKLNEFCNLTSLDDMYFWAKNHVKEINQEEFFSFILQCAKYEFDKLKGIETLSEGDEKNIFGGLFDFKLKSAVSASLAAILAISPVSGVEVGKSNKDFKDKIQKTKLSGLEVGKKINHYDKSKILKTIGKIGGAGLASTAFIGTVGFTGGYLYRQSDNAFQRATIGSTDRIRATNENFENLIAQKIIIDNRLQGYKYTSANAQSQELAGKYVIFYSGSGSSNTFQICDVAEYYTKKGATVIGVDYEGFGKSGEKVSSGKIRQENIYKDAVATYDYVRQNLNISSSDIIIHGYSLGGPVAAHVASKASVKGDKLHGLILQSSMKNTPNAAKGTLANKGSATKFFGTLGSFLFVDQFDCEKELKQLYKHNPNIKVNICAGNEQDGLRLESTRLDEIAKKIGFKNLKIYSGEKGHLVDSNKAPVENFTSDFSSN